MKYNIGASDGERNIGQAEEDVPYRQPASGVPYRFNQYARYTNNQRFREAQVYHSYQHKQECERHGSGHPGQPDS